MGRVGIHQNRIALRSDGAVQGLQRDAVADNMRLSAQSIARQNAAVRDNHGVAARMHGADDHVRVVRIGQVDAAHGIGAT